MSSQFYYLHPRIAFRRIGDTTYILPVRTGKPLYLLRGWAQTLWNHLLKLSVISVEDLVIALSPLSLPISTERLKDDLYVFLQKLSSEGLLLPQGVPTPNEMVLLRPVDYRLLWDIADRQVIPLKVDLELTYRCNLRCKYCYVNSEQLVNGLSGERLVTLLDELTDVGCLFLTFTGGEPFMRHDLLDLLREAGRRWFAIRVLTNGTLLSESKVQVLSEIGHVMVEISIHGATPEQHDAFTQQKGSFAAVQRAVKLLRDARIPTTLKLSITHLNANDVTNIRRLAEDWKVPLITSPLIFPSAMGETDITTYRVSDEQLRSLMAEGEYTPRPLRCHAGRAKGWIAPNGEVYPCEFIRLSMGNVVRNAFASIWWSKEMRRFRTGMPFVPHSCRRCPHRPYCPTCPGIAWLEHGSLSVPSLEACRICRVWDSLNRSSPDRNISASLVTRARGSLPWRGGGR